MENLDLTQLLKDCPVGTKFYSPLFGEVTFVGIVEGEGYSICVERERNRFFTKEGRYFDYPESECTLFPSKENRDWSKFKVKQQQRTKFKPFQKVLVRDREDDEWWPQVYSHYSEGLDYPHICIGCAYKMCIPYDGNEHLIGTKLI